MHRVFTDEFPISKSASLTGLHPRAPTGSEWSREPRGSDRELVPLHEVLQDLDLQAALGLVPNHEPLKFTGQKWEGLAWRTLCMYALSTLNYAATKWDGCLLKAL